MPPHTLTNFEVQRYFETKKKKKKKKRQEKKRKKVSVEFLGETVYSRK